MRLVPAGDVIGEYCFKRPLDVGDTVVFGGLGCYSFAQQSWFNGIRHPDVVLVSKADGERTVLSWDYPDYLRDFLGRESGLCNAVATAGDCCGIISKTRRSSGTDI